MAAKASTTDNVFAELIGDYECTEAQAQAAIKKYPQIIVNAMDMGSYAYYPASKIAKAEGFAYHGRLTESQVEEEDEN